MITMDIGGRIREVRKARGWSQPRLTIEARRFLTPEKRLARETISRLEMGHHLPDLWVLQAIAAALEVGVEELLRAEATPVGDLVSAEVRAGQTPWAREVKDLAERLNSLPAGARAQAVEIFDRMLDLIDERVAEVGAALEDPNGADQVQRLVRLLDSLPEARRAYWEHAIQTDANAATRAVSPTGRTPGARSAG
jgi:transcriptional regulator with XRE-family HTH domain